MKLILSLFIILTLPCLNGYAAALTAVDDFGDNPGDINMYKYVPEDMPDNAPLVVSLHGCLQDAETYSNVGWIEQA